VPELPETKQRRFVTELGLDAMDAAVLSEERAVAEFFEDALAVLRAVAPQHSQQSTAKTAANWITGELFRLMKANAVGIDECRVSPAGLAELIVLVEAGEINLNSGKRVLNDMFESGRPANEVVQALGLRQVSDADALAQIVSKVIESNEDQVIKYRAGKESVFNWLLGQVMRETRGKGNPALVRELLERALRD
jgi:aspartyl-tRNA(Asn)/glutamyl-tRNA(Gln) amidotransferase subunit B